LKRKKNKKKREEQKKKKERTISGMKNKPAEHVHDHGGLRCPCTLSISGGMGQDQPSTLELRYKWGHMARGSMVRSECSGVHAVRSMVRREQIVVRSIFNSEERGVLRRG
jgi:hypothetical protein